MHTNMQHGAQSPGTVTPRSDEAQAAANGLSFKGDGTGNSRDCRGLQAGGQDLPAIRASLTPRHRRVLQALLSGPQTREAGHRIAHASNAPDEILRLRRGYGLEIPCARRQLAYRDGHLTQFGTGYLAERDQAVAVALLADQEGGMR